MRLLVGYRPQNGKIKFSYHEITGQASNTGYFLQKPKDDELVCDLRQWQLVKLNE